MNQPLLTQSNLKVATLSLSLNNSEFFLIASAFAGAFYFYSYFFTSMWGALTF